MWLGLAHRWYAPRRMRLARAAIAFGIAATVAILAPPSRSHSTTRTASPCIRIGVKVARYCGRASARLSVFPEARFKGGFCARKMVGGVALLQVRIGIKALDGSPANDGLPYFSLGSAGSRSHPESGNVIAFFRSRGWLGRLVSLRGDVGVRMFVAQGVAGSHGCASGRFRC
jgi:hypothetical protein